MLVTDARRLRLHNACSLIIAQDIQCIQDLDEPCVREQ